MNRLHPQIPRTRLAIVLPTMLTVASVALFGCSRAPVAPAAAKRTRADSASQKLYGLHAPMTHNGITRGILQADSAFVYEEGMRLELRGVRAAIEGPTGLALGVMTAKEGVVTLANSQVTLRGAVEITSATGRHVQTSQVIFDLKTNRLLGDSAYTVRASKNGKPTAGVGFTSDPALARLQSPADFRKEEAAAAQRAAKAAADSAARKAKTKAAVPATAKAKPAPGRARSTP
jgi:hypothetical protein